MGSTWWYLVGAVAVVVGLWATPHGPVAMGVAAAVAGAGFLWGWAHRRQVARAAALSLVVAGGLAVVGGLAGSGPGLPPSWVAKAAATAAWCTAVWHAWAGQGLRGAEVGPWGLFGLQLLHQTFALREEVLRVRRAWLVRRPEHLSRRQTAALGQAFLLKVLARGDSRARALAVRVGSLYGRRMTGDSRDERGAQGGKAPPALEMRQAWVLSPEGRPILRNLNLVLHPGERVAVLGYNGAGKTSLLLAIAGLFPHRGFLAVAGQPLEPGTSERIRRFLGVLFSNPEDQLLLPKVWEDLQLGASRNGTGDRETRELLEQLGIAHLAQALVATLSQGEKALVALAGALLRRPQLLLLDEPSAHLDPPHRRRVLEVLRRYPGAVLVATHDLTFARALASRYLWLDGGGVAASGEDWEALSLRWG